MSKGYRDAFPVNSESSANLVGRPDFFSMPPKGFAGTHFASMTRDQRLALFRQILEAGNPGEAYNLASGSMVTIRTILDTLCRIAGCEPEITVDPDRYREEKEPPPTLSVDKIHEHTGWAPTRDLDQTLADLLGSLDRS